MRRLATSLLGAKLALSTATVLAAQAAGSVTQALAQAHPGDIGIVNWAFILLFSNLGWAVGYLDTIAEWFDDGTHDSPASFRRIWAQRLKNVVRPWLAANAAGIVFYFLAEGAPGWFGWNTDLPDMIEFVGVFVAAMGGLKTLDWVRGKFFGGATGQGSQP